MSVTTDKKTILGDGSSTNILATGVLADIDALQNYADKGTLASVADPTMGGTFTYVQAQAFKRENLTFKRKSISLQNTYSGFFQKKQTIYIRGVGADYDKAYFIASDFDGKNISVGQQLVNETNPVGGSIDISFQNDFNFEYSTVTESGVVKKIVIIHNLNFTSFPKAGFLVNGFYPTQTIVVTGTVGFNATFTIDSVTNDTIKAYVTTTYPVSEIAYATLTDANAPYKTDTLTFNNNGSALDTISDTTNYLHEHFRVNQIIKISGTTNNNKQFKVLSTSTTSSGSEMVIAPIFSISQPVDYEVEPSASIIKLAPLQTELEFAYNSSTNIITIFNSNFTNFPDAGFVANKFFIGQTITVAGAAAATPPLLSFNGVYTIASVSEDTITVTVNPSDHYPASEKVTASLTGNASYTTSTLTFNKDGKNPYTIIDTTTGLSTNFLQGQIIQISNTVLNNGQFKIASITATLTTSQLIVEPIFETYLEQLATATTCEGGINFPAIGKTTGMWRRNYDPKGGLSVSWFGAKGQASVADNTVAIQNAINFAALNPQSIYQVYFPHGTYNVSQLIIPRGVNLKGEGSNQSGGGTRLVQISEPGIAGKSMLLFQPFASGNDLLYWDGKISDIALQGDTSSTYGFGISFRTVEGYRIALDDMAILDNLFVRDFKSGGIEIPLGAAPAFIMNSKMERNGGPGISIIKPLAARAEVQSASFINISGDGNINGLFAIGGYDSTNTFIFINLKGENSESNSYSTGSPKTIEQQNMFKLTDNCNAMMSIHGACNQPVVDRFGGRVAIGDLINNDDTTCNPIVFWNGVNYRYNSLQVLEPGRTTLPRLLSRSTSNISNTQNAGYTGGKLTTDNIQPTADNTFSLGKSDYRYASAYVNSVQAATINATTANASTVNATTVNASNLLKLGTSGSYSPSVSTDPDTITNSVAAFIQSGTPHTPSGSGSLLSLGISSNYSNQLYLRNGINAVYSRTNNNGSWSSWAKLVTANAIPAVTDADYTITSSEQMVKLPLITANRTLTLPAVSTWIGCPLTIWNKNTTGFSWSIGSGASIVDATGTAITTLSNQTVYQLISDGTNWVKVN